MDGDNGKLKGRNRLNDWALLQSPAVRELTNLEYRALIYFLLKRDTTMYRERSDTFTMSHAELSRLMRITRRRYFGGNFGRGRSVPGLINRFEVLGFFDVVERRTRKPAVLRDSARWREIGKHRSPNDKAKKGDQGSPLEGELRSPKNGQIRRTQIASYSENGSSYTTTKDGGGTLPEEVLNDVLRGLEE